MQQQAVKVDVRDLKLVTCECGGEHFEAIMNYRILPALYSNTGAEQMLAVQVSRCIACKKVWDLDSLYKDFSDRKGKILLKQ
jgi:hypothetical protein